jgi:hypothetical protein
MKNLMLEVQGDNRTKPNLHNVQRYQLIWGFNI